jgi:hypothetical protein
VSDWRLGFEEHVKWIGVRDVARASACPTKTVADLRSELAVAQLKELDPDADSV